MKTQRGKVLLTFFLSSFVCFLLLYGGVRLYLHQAGQKEIFGQTVSVTTEELSFSGEEIPDLASLREALSPFKELRRLNLGSFAAEARELQSFRAAFPHVEVTAPSYVTLQGVRYPSDTSELNLADTAVSYEQLQSVLPYFSSLDRLYLGDMPLTVSMRDTLTTLRPGVTVEAKVVYPLYGGEYPENTTHLDLREVAVDGDLATHLSHFPSLTSVDLHGADLSVESKLALRQAFPHVLFGWTVDILGREIDSLTEELDLSGKTVRDLPAFRQAVSLLCGLKTLVMCDCGVSNEDMAALREEFPAVKVVWRVYMGEKWSLRTDAVTFSVLIRVHDYTSMTSEDIQVLKYCTDLQALDLGHQAITDISVIGDYLPNLRVLILADNRITDISPLAKLKKLHYVELFVNKITNVSPLASCRELVDVNLSYNKELSDISCLLDLPMIERFWMEHTALSAKDEAALHTAYPQAKVVTVGEGSVDQGWRTHERYYAMRDMWRNNYISESFSKFDTPDP